jgi:RNA polymerase sigma factor (sigma-70 family)
MSAPTMEPTAPTGPPVDQSSAEDDLSLALDVFLAERKRLFRIAYQVLNDISGAEDVVQEVWLRWQRTHRTEIKNPAAFLTTATTRLAINVIQSARHRHETPTESQWSYLGDGTAHDPVLRAEQAMAIEEALAQLMARLTPDALAAYVLRKGFDYNYADLATFLRTSVANARVVVHRAQARLASDSRQPVPAESHRRLVAAFRTAADTGDLQDLTRLLAPESRVHRSVRRLPA